MQIKNANNELVKCKALLDSGAQSNFITLKLLGKLKLPTNPVNMQISGINQTMTNINKSVDTCVKSMHNNFETQFKCLVVPKVTENLPNNFIDKSTMYIPKNLKVADPTFNRPSSIDLLIGAELFLNLLCIGQIHRENQPTLQKTHFGWIISGPIMSNNKQTIACHNSTTLDLNNAISKFWEIENYETKINLSPLKQQCENHFKSTFKRDDTGRFIVKLPFKNNNFQLGDSFTQARNRFLNLEKKLNNPSLKQEYKAFIHEYFS